MPMMKSRLPFTAALLVAVAMPAAAMMHNRLINSAPLASKIVPAPKTISLWFAEKPELALSTIALAGADSAAVKLGAVTELVGESHALTVTVEGALTTGKHVVRYKTVGTDGHPLRGSYTFVVK